jgi:hypothetical protein
MKECVCVCVRREGEGEGTYPEGDQSMAVIFLTWPSRTQTVRPVRASQTRPMASRPLRERN